MKKIVYAFLTVLIWGTSAATVKLMMASIPDLETLSVSSVFAFAFLLVLNISTGKLKELKSTPKKAILKMAGLGFIGLFLYSALYYCGVDLLTAQEACILNYLWPIMILLFSCMILKEPFTPRKILAMVCSFVGVIILTAGSLKTLSGNQALGITVCILAAVCYGLFSVLNKKADMDQNLTMMVIWATTAVCAFLSGNVLEEWVPIRGTAWLGLLWLGVIIDGLAYLLWAKVLNGAEDTAKIANLAYLTPFLSVLISGIVLGEKISLTALIALQFIVGGILIQSLGGAGKEKS